MTYDPLAVEARWRRRWEREGWYKVDPADSESTFITVPYPYPSGGMHIGHARTYTVPDVYARYQRLRGRNVLFPIAWHVTGTPIIGAVERLKNREPQQLSVLRDTYNVPEDVLDDLESPMGFARYFIEEHYKKGMKRLGLSIDWRREFTTNDPRYQRFISWQYETLHQKNLLEKGKHPVKYCTNERNPVTTHDLLEGEEAEFQEYTLIKFQWDGTIVPMATLRPETVRGVTNAFIDPMATYVVAAVDNETWLISKSAVEKLRLQDRKVEINDEFIGERLVGESVVNPVTKDELLVLPAKFVDANNATGVVMSVPGHSPDDWVALHEAKADHDRMETFGIEHDLVESIDPRSIIAVDGYGEFPARDAVEKFQIESTSDPTLKEATQEVYNREFHAGRLKEMYGDKAGALVEEIRDEIKSEYVARGYFDEMFEFSEEVICRCGGSVEVAYQDTWFLRYNDLEWKEKTHRLIDDLDTIPENTREQYHHTVDWLIEWPCIRNYGLGTRLPWDEDFVIEPLSDSTIYMAYYTFAHRLQDLSPEDLDHSFFDSLFLNGNSDEPDPDALPLREEWKYWYPIDYRCSANDLITNHLTFFLFHHAELFKKEECPQGITIMGMGLLEGEKMSSSKGHVVLPGEAIDQYGADTVRFFLLNSAEPWQDYDWRSDQVKATRSQLDRFWNRALDVIDSPAGERKLEHPDRWLLSRLQRVIRDVTDAMDRFETRTASQAAFYQIEEDLRWFRRRTKLDRAGARWTLQHVLEIRLRLLAPIIPFLTNELHENLTGQPAEAASWPAVNPSLESDAVESKEVLIRNLVDDIGDILDVIGKEPDEIQIFTADEWKYQLFDFVTEYGLDVGDVMNQVMQHEKFRERGGEIHDLVQSMIEFHRDRPDHEIETLREFEELAVYSAVIDFLEREFDAHVSCASESTAEDPTGRAARAIPYRPAIEIN